MKEVIPTNYNAPDIPLKSYVVLMGIYAGVFSLLHRASRAQPPAPRGREWLVLTIGSYKLSRIVTMSFIGAPLRAPFCVRGESLKGGEVRDEARGTGLQKAIGHMLTCPFCFNVWSATAFAFGYRLFPRATAQAARIFTMAAVGDLLHFAYRNIRENSD